MDLWTKVLLIQAAICCVAVLAGRAVFRIDWRDGFLAALLVTPAPLFKVSSGAAGFIYTSDVVALFYLLSVMLRTSREHLPKKGQSLVFWALLTLVLLPCVSTLFGWPADPAARSWKSVALGLARGIGYVAIFHMFIRRGLELKKVSKIAAVQILAFTLICMCGLLQHLKGVDLDLWNMIRGLDKWELIDHNLGGGFMGLYRGAVGAWAIGFLALVPLITTTHRWMVWIMPICVTCIIGAVLVVGSRQGVVIGLIALGASFFGLVRLGTSSERIQIFLKGCVGLVLLAVIATFAWRHYATNSLQTFVAERFASIESWDSAVHEAVNRTSTAPIAWHHITSNSQMLLIGAGYGGEDSDIASSPVRVIMLDSEFLYVWQLGGIVLVLAYAALLWKIRRTQAKEQVIDVEDQSFIFGSRVVLYTGILLTYGHFFILSVQASEAPVGYWIWSIFGLSIGVCLKYEFQQQSFSEEIENGANILVGTGSYEPAVLS